MGVLAGAVRTQAIALRAGWNAVYLEVMPADTAPASVFGGLPVDIVASYLPVLTAVEFIEDPGEEPWKKAGWTVWYSAGREDAFLSTLHEVFGLRAYLIHSTEATTWNVTGEVRVRRALWQPDSFNFVGVTVNPASPPTFAQYFLGGDAFAESRFYRLVNDKWELVTAPGTALVESGQAYWVFCRGASRWNGPLELSCGSRRGVDFGATADGTDLDVVCRAVGPVEVTLRRASGPGVLPLVRAVPAPDGLSTERVDLSTETDLGQIAPGSAVTVPLQVRRERMDQPDQQALLSFVTDCGVVYWLPVRASRPDLQP